MRPSNSAFDSLYCNLLSKPNFEVEEENSLSTRAWCTKRLCSLTAVLLLSNIYPSRQETPNLIGKKKKNPERHDKKTSPEKAKRICIYARTHICSCLLLEVYPATSRHYTQTQHNLSFTICACHIVHQRQQERLAASNHRNWKFICKSLEESTRFQE